MSGNEIYRKSIVMLLGITVFIAAFAAAPAAMADSGRKKAVVLIIDNIALRDLSGGGLPNFSKIIESGGLGLMNTRVESYTGRNRVSAYLSIGMGVRTYLDTPEINAENGRPAGPLYEVYLENAGDLKQSVSRDYPNYVFGHIGETAEQYGLKTALVGNADTDRALREAALLAVDNNGKIKYGNVSEDLLIKDESAPWGRRTNSDRLLADALAALETCDLVFIDFGDTARVYEAQQRLGLKGGKFREAKNRALHNADTFLGRFLGEMDDNTLLAVITPSPPGDGTEKGNTTLTPVIIYGRTLLPAVLTSGTTKRIGLVANIDIGPTLFDWLTDAESVQGFIGEKITLLTDNNNLNTVSDNLSRFIHLNRSRYVVHGMYTLLLVLSLSAMFLPLTGKKLFNSPRVGRAAALMVLALPIASFVVYTVFNGVTTQRYYLDALMTAVLAAVSGIIFSGNTRRTLAGMAVLGMVTAVFMVTDLLTGYRYVIDTPLGFDNVFMGGRYYGINNDCMGILLGSSVFALFYVLEKFKVGRYLRLFLVLAAFIPIILSQVPGNGSNVGGTIAAMSIAIIALMALISGLPLKKRRLFAAILIVFLVELFIAYLDYLFGGRTHAGKVLGALISQGFGPKFLEVLLAKLRLFAITLALPPWNILFALQLYVYYIMTRKQEALIMRVGEHHPLLLRSFEVIFYGGIVAFLFNDTGLIATGLMFTYLTMPMGVLAVENQNLCVYTCKQKQRI